MSILDSVKSSLRDELITQLGNPNLSNERKYIFEMVLKAINNLYNLGIYIYPNIIELFNINGFKGSPLLCDVILNITDKIQSQLNDHVEWISYRTMKKCSMKAKNIIICFLLFTYKENFIKYLHEYFLKNKQNEKEKITNLITNLQKIIDDAHINYKKNIQQPNNLSIDTFVKDVCSKDQNLNIKIIDQDESDDKLLFKELDDFSNLDNGFPFY